MLVILFGAVGFVIGLVLGEEGSRLSMGLICGIAGLLVGFFSESRHLSLSRANYYNEIKAGLSGLVDESIWTTLVTAVSSISRGRVCPEISEPDFAALVKHCQTVQFEKKLYSLTRSMGQLVLVEI